MYYRDLALELIKHIQLPSKPGHKNIIDELSGGGVVFLFIFHKQRVLPKQIAEAFGVSTARVAAVLNKLSGKGLITREIDEQDRRQIIVKLTEHGKVVAKEQQQQIIEQATYFLTQLGEHDAKEYVRIMGRLAEIGKSSISQGE